MPSSANLDYAGGGARLTATGPDSGTRGTLGIFANRGDGSGNLSLLSSDAGGGLSIGSGAISLPGLPTACSGLATGRVWSNSGVLSVCP